MPEVADKRRAGVSFACRDTLNSTGGCERLVSHSSDRAGFTERDVEHVCRRASLNGDADSEGDAEWGGAATHEITVPSVSTMYTARFQRSKVRGQREP
jgi:hypothetical protein